MGKENFRVALQDCCGDYFTAAIDMSVGITKSLGVEFQYKGRYNDIDGLLYILFSIDGQVYRLDVDRDSEDYISIWDALGFRPVTRKIVEFEVWN